MDLTKMRYLVGALVQKYGRHDRHAKTGPILGKHSCARGKPECTYCRYGFPHARRTLAEGLSLEKGEREGQWDARFPRNDALVCSHDAHIMLANMGNIDWRPCLNLWAVVHYICKYATKAPEGSKKLGEVLRDAVEEVCKFTRTGEPVDFLRKSLQKFYSRTLGDRDYTIMEAMFLGLRLPLMFSLLPVVSLNTTGTRALKTAAQMLNAGPDEEIAWSSKVDKFDDRLGLLRRHFPRPEQDPLRLYWESLVQDTSLYEFYWKYNVYRGRIAKTTQDVCLMVTPALCASSACVTHDRHEIFARTCVVAYWRCISSEDRARLWSKMPVRDPCFFGGTVLQAPAPLAGSRPSQLDRFIGVRDLVAAFDGPKHSELVWEEAPEGSLNYVFKRMDLRSVAYGWTFALMEMLVDPVLLEWVPQYVVEQYRRWNPFFVEALKSVGASRSAGNRRKPFKSNRHLLRSVHARMVKLADAQHGEDRKAEDEAAAGASGSDSAAVSSDEGGPADEAQQLEENTRSVIINESLPTFGDDGPDDGHEAGDWAKASVEARLSAAGPGDAPPERPRPSLQTRTSAQYGQVNPVGHQWEAENFVPRAQARTLQELWQTWCGQDVFSIDELRGDQAAQELADKKADKEESLDPWQEFARDVLARRGMDDASPPLRLILTGTAGSGKSRTIKAGVRARSMRSVKNKFDVKQQRRVCVLAAPTGCASFQLKNGATTIHRAFGVPVGFCGETKNKQTVAFCRRQERLRNAGIFIIDEFSMVGRQMLGKILYKVRECLPGAATFGGKDVALAGDLKQAMPIGDDPMFRYGPYVGKGLNKPRNAEMPAGAPSLVALSKEGELFREEFQDVVILREVHRIDREAADLDPIAAAQYEQDADEFLEVTNGMANCTWTPKQHAWLSRRNRSWLSKTEEGRRELLAFEEAPLLMDGRKPNTAGEDGSTQVNEEELFRMADRTKKPVLSIAAFHKGFEEGSRPDLMFDEDFKGMEANLLLCEMARVLLKSNLWPEAGLMNGALGNVRGFIWPEGGDPHSENRKLQSPVCVVVEFDLVDLGEEVALDDRNAPIVEDGRIVYRRRNFFPSLVEALGVDAKGVPRACRCVPIFHTKTTAESDAQVCRHQFPLVLAWALTHWKAQGMSLRRAKIRMGKRTASQPGIGFVAITRVSHPTHFVFDIDLPAWEHFQEAQWKANFRARRRFEWRLEAKASRTLRKYGYCRADEWSKDDASIAEELLKGLENKAAERRRDMGLGNDPDAWCWQRDEVPVETLLLKQVQAFAQRHACDMASAERVAQRLNGPWHRPAVLEALGCLIPRAFHRRQDGKPPPGKAVREPGMMVHLQAGSWKIDAFEEQALVGLSPGAEARLLKGVMEFFLIVLRRVCERLHLPIVLGTQRLGYDLQTVRNEEDMQLMLMTLKSWAHWERMVTSTASAKLFQVPVALDDAKQLRDCVLVNVSPLRADESLGTASGFKVDVYDVVGRSSLATRLSSNIVKLLSPSQTEVQLEQHTLTASASPFERGFAVLGVLIGAIMSRADCSFHDPLEPDFVAKVRKSLGSCFGTLRAEADKSGNRDVLAQLTTDDACKALLKVLGAPQECQVPSPLGHSVPKQSNVKVVEISAFQPLQVLTWNINGSGKSSRAPKSFSMADKMAAVQQEICRRWNPDLVSLQECLGPEPLEMLLESYALVGAAPAEHCGFVHLYVRRGLHAELLPMVSDCPAVLARITVCKGNTFDVAALHMVPGPTGKEERKKQFLLALRGLRPGSQLVLGDMNVRPDELQDLTALGQFRDAEYVGKSWHPAKSGYEASEGFQRGGLAFSFDRIFFSGALCVEAFLVGQGRVFSEGIHFSLSDHCAVLGLLDLHASHKTGAQGSEVRRERRGALAKVRDHACLEEQCVVTAMSRDGRQASAQQRATVDAKQQAAVVRAQRAQIKERKVHRDALWESAFGAHSLFRAPGRQAQLPARAADSCPLEAHAADVPALERLPFAARGVAANALAQVFLRIPKVATWLRNHACEQDAEKCSACALEALRRDFRAELGHSLQSAPVFKVSSSLRACVRDLLSNMLLHAPRAVPWEGIDEPPACDLTTVDALFGFVWEVRCRCSRCGRSEVRFERDVLLELPMPVRSSTRHSLPDLYLQGCTPSNDQATKVCESDQCKGALANHVTQKRMLHLPQVLLVSVCREAQQETHARYPFHADDTVSLPGCGNADLVAVVYGKTYPATKTHFTCAVRDIDNSWWYFEDMRPPRNLGRVDMSDLCRHCVDLLVYVPTLAHVASEAAFGQVLQITSQQKQAVEAPVSTASVGASPSSVVPSVISVDVSQPVKVVVKRKQLHVGRALTTPAGQKHRVLGNNIRDNPFWCMFGADLTQRGESAGGAENEDVPRVPLRKKRRGGLDTTKLWDKLVNGLQIPCDVVTGVLASFGSRFGLDVACNIAEEQWICDLKNWIFFAEKVLSICSESTSEAMPLVIGPSCDVVFAVTRLVLQQQSVVIPVSKSDQEMLHELAEAGWEWRQAETWAENDCLVDSLLQDLEFHGALVGEHGSLTVDERRSACLAARQHLIGTPELLPEDPYGRPQWDAYLQHYRHAEALVFFLLTRFLAGPSPLSADGVTLVVHARYDTPETPAEVLSLCVRPGGRRGVAPELHLFNWTGGGLQGYHYDALVRVRHAHVVVVDADGALPNSICPTVGQGAARPLELDPTTAASSTEDIDKSRPKRRLKAIGTHQARREVVNDSPTSVIGSIAPDVDLEQWEEELRKRYTPTHIDSGKCQARVFGAGKGGQCPNNRPKHGRTCGRCGAEPKHGLVTGRVPTGKWKAFGVTDELVRQLGGGVPTGKPGSGGVSSARLGNEPPQKRQTAVPTVAPVLSVPHADGQAG